MCLVATFSVHFLLRLRYFPALSGLDGHRMEGLVVMLCFWKCCCKRVANKTQLMFGSLGLPARPGFLCFCPSINEVAFFCFLAKAALFFADWVGTAS